MLSDDARILILVRKSTNKLLLVNRCVILATVYPT
jgi:hypothetical protein